MCSWSEAQLPVPVCAQNQKSNSLVYFLYQNHNSPVCVLNQKHDSPVSVLYQKHNSAVSVHNQKSNSPVCVYNQKPNLPVGVPNQKPNFKLCVHNQKPNSLVCAHNQNHNSPVCVHNQKPNSPGCVHNQKPNSRVWVLYQKSNFAVLASESQLSGLCLYQIATPREVVIIRIRTSRNEWIIRNPMFCMCSLFIIGSTSHLYVFIIRNLTSWYLNLIKSTSPPVSLCGQHWCIAVFLRVSSPPGRGPGVWLG